MAYKVKFPDGNQIVVNSLSEKIEYLCHKEYYEPFLVKGKISDNIEAWNVSIYKENNFIKIDLPLKPESLTVKVNFVDDKGNPLSGMGKFAKVVPSGREKLVGETLFATFIGEAIKLIDQTKITITDDTYEVASVKYRTVNLFDIGSADMTISEMVFVPSVGQYIPMDATLLMRMVSGWKIMTKRMLIALSIRTWKSSCLFNQWTM